MNTNETKLATILEKYNRHLTQEERGRIFMIALEFSNNFNNLQETDKKNCLKAIDHALEQIRDDKEKNILLEEKRKANG